MRTERADDSLLLDLPLKLYPLEAIYSACYVFVDRCWILLDQKKAGRVLVRIKVRRKSDSDIEALAADFSGELIRQALRLKIAKRTASVREMLVGRALLAAEPLTLDPIEGEPQDDYLADPLGIAVPWEERFGDGKLSSDETGPSGIEEPHRPGEES